MLVTRAELRKLRNKIYVRIISKQNFHNHLRKYSSLIEAFISICGSSLHPEEITDLWSRLKLTQKAAAAAATTSSSKSADLFFVKKDRQLQGKQMVVSTVPYISSMVRPLDNSYKAESSQYQSFSLESSNKAEDSHLSQLIVGMDATELEATFAYPSVASQTSSTRDSATRSITARIKGITTSQLSSRTSFGYSPCPTFESETTGSSDEPDTGIVSCCTMHSRSQKILMKEDKGIDNMLLLLQAILVMLFTMSEFVHCNLGRTPPHLSAQSKKVTAQTQSEQTVDWREFTELGCVTRKMIYQWVLWLHQAVWLSFLSVITSAWNLVNNVGKREKWKQVKDVFTRNDQ